MSLICITVVLHLLNLRLQLRAQLVGVLQVHQIDNPDVVTVEWSPAIAQGQVDASQVQRHVHVLGLALLPLGEVGLGLDLNGDLDRLRSLCELTNNFEKWSRVGGGKEVAVECCCKE